MNILIYGLPTSGKTTFAEKLVKKVGTSVIRHLNADKVRESFGDWEFSPEGRQRQALRMSAIAKMNSVDGFNSIVDFVCPFNVYREMPIWDMTIWVNTICESPYEDTNKIFEEPKKEPTYTIFNWEEVDDIIEEVAYKLLNQEEE
jgi:GTPase SAR1 family protein